MSLRRYSRRDLVGRRLSSLPNGAKRGLDGVTCPELRLRGGAHGRTALSYLPFSLPILIGMHVVVSMATTWVKLL